MSDTSCPRCGSADTRQRPGLFATGRVCHVCRKRFTPAVGGKLLVLVYAVPALAFAVAAVVIGRTIVESAPASTRNTNEGLLCSSTCAIPALFFFMAIRQFRDRGKGPTTAVPGVQRDDFLEAREAPVPVPLPPLVPRRVAEAIVRELADHYGLKGVLEKLGNFREADLANAKAAFADQMGEDETPLAFVDRSLMINGKAGVLVTNRGLYTSRFPHVVWLKDIVAVSYERPDGADIALTTFIILTSHTICFPIGLVFLMSGGLRRMQDRFIVNGKVVYRKAGFRTPAFWVELLIDLGEAARRVRLPVLELESHSASTDVFLPGAQPLTRTEVFRPDSPRPPRSVVLATVHSAGEGQPPDVRRFSDPTAEQIEQAIRDLDARDRPSLRLSAGEGEGAVLEIRGGNGKYTLRQPGDGWVYYDPSANEEEIEVCEGHRCPAFYVCTELPTVLRIARHFVETGDFE